MRPAAGTLLLALLLPVLLVRPVFEGLVAWIHAHDGHGEHVHFAPALEHEGAHERTARHEHSHADGHRDHPAPAGTVVSFAFGAPELAPAGNSAFPTCAPLFLELCSSRASVPRTHDAQTAFHPSSWPPQQRWRSGVAELLRSSHALLI